MSPPSDTYGSSTYQSTAALGVPNSPSARRVVSNPNPSTSQRSHERSRGFLLDTAAGSGRSSLDRSRGFLESTPDHGRRVASSFLPPQVSDFARQDAAPESTVAPSDPAAVVSMILSKRKGEGGGFRRQSPGHEGGHRSTSVGLRAGSPMPGRDSTGDRNNTPQPRPFLVSTRSTSTSSAPRIPQTPPMSIPEPSRSNTSTPASPQGVPWVELSSPDYDYEEARSRPYATYAEPFFSEATILRMEKAKRILDLAEFYRKLIDLESAAGNDAIYNPLQAIRDRKIRAKNKVQLDISHWKDCDAVRGWIDHVEDSIIATGGSELLPPPPGDAEGVILRRPKMEWHVGPEELFADFYWSLNEKHMQRKTNDFKENERFPWLPKGAVTEDPFSLAKPMNLLMPPIGPRTGHYGSTASSDEESISSEVIYSSASESDREVENPKHHRRRRKLGAIITGKHRRKTKDSAREEESRRKQREYRESEWPVIAPNDDTGFGANDGEEFDRDHGVSDGYHHPYPPPPETSPPPLPIGKISSDPYAPTGLGLSGDTPFVVQSIAISLSPPRPNNVEEDPKPPSSSTTAINPKKLLSKGKDAFGFLDRDNVDEDPRESLDLTRPRKSGELPRAHITKDTTPSKKKLGMVKTRVDKLRSEVSKVEDYIPWKNPGAPSPTASSFTGSDVEEGTDAYIMRRDTTVSGSDIDEVPPHRRSRSSLEVPRIDRSRRPSKHRSAFSTSVVTEGGKSNGRRSMSIDRDKSPRRLELINPHVIRAPSSSSVKDATIEPLSDRKSISLDPFPSPAMKSWAARKSIGQEQSTRYRRDPNRAYFACLRAGIVAREIASSISSPPSASSAFVSTQRSLAELATHRQIFLADTTPKLTKALTALSSDLDATTKALEKVGKKSHTAEFEAQQISVDKISRTREDLRRLKRRGRSTLRRTVRLGSSLLGLFVTVLLRCVWAVYSVGNLVFLLCVFPVIWTVKMVAGAVKFVGRWLLWL